MKKIYKKQHDCSSRFSIEIKKDDFKNVNFPIFYIDDKSDLYFDEILSKDNLYSLTNINEKHFIWIHTPTLLKSVNQFYTEKLNNL